MHIKLTTALILFACSTWSHADILYIQSQKAFLLDAPKFAANKILQLSQGDKVESLQTQGNWYQITAQGKAGWVSKLLLKPHPPLERVSVLASADDSFKENVRRRSSSIVTAGAARGLASEERSRIHQNNEANYFALKKVESLNIDEAELQQFAELLSTGSDK